MPKMLKAFRFTPQLNRAPRHKSNSRKRNHVFHGQGRRKQQSLPSNASKWTRPMGSTIRLLEFPKIWQLGKLLIQITNKQSRAHLTSIF